MTDATDLKADKILDRVQKLLAIADHPNTGEHEREVALAQANSLITKHAIDEALLWASQTTEQRRAPEKRNITLAEGMAYNSVYSSALASLRSILEKMARTYRCSVALTNKTADLYGAREDVAWVEMLYTSVYFQMMSKINPSWSSDKGYDENVYIFKVAGYKWREINEQSIKHGGVDARVFETIRGPIQDVRDYDTDPEGEPIWEPKYIWDTNNFRSCVWTHRNEGTTNDQGSWEIPTDKISGSMISAYRRHAKLIGDTNPVATQSHDVYKLSFIEGFKSTMYYRLQKAWEDAQEQMDTIPGAALAIQDLSEEARQMMYGDHPDLDPEEQRRQREAAKQEYADMLAAMSPAERQAYLEEQERLARRANKPRKIKYYDLDDSAARRGQGAASEVNMARNAGSAGRTAARGELA